MNIDIPVHISERGGSTHVLFVPGRDESGAWPFFKSSSSSSSTARNHKHVLNLQRFHKTCYAGGIKKTEGTHKVAPYF